VDRSIFFLLTTDNHISFGLTDSLKMATKVSRAFIEAAKIPGCPNGMAAFTKEDINSKTNTIFFTPNSLHIAKSFTAAPCEEPKRSEVTLLFGDGTFFFPE
jgi:hypothetical protein